MGGSNSKSIASSFNTVVTEAITKNIISCVYTASQDQNIVIKNTIGDVTIRNAVLSQSTVINSSCLQKALSDANVQNAISNDILQNTSAETYAMLDAFTASGSSSTAMINNMTRNMFTTENISNTLNEVKQSQSINIESTVGNVVLENINMTQGAKLIAQSLADNANILQTMTSYENSANQTTSLTSEGPLDFLGDYAWVIVAIVVLVILALTGYFIFRSGSKSGGLDTIFGGCDKCGGKNNQL
jgi:cobalamin biosynthesis Mg chelatase CobN